MKEGFPTLRVDVGAQHAAALQSDIVRRNMIDAAERAQRCLIYANIGLHRLTGLQHDTYTQSVTALDLLIRALKFDR